MKKNKTILASLLLVLLGILQSAALSAQTYMLKTGDKITTDDGVYVVTGSNLVTNPEFNDGLAGWKAGNGSDLSESKFEIQPTGGPDGSPCLHALSGAGSGSDASIKTGWAVEEGKTYVFSCWAYRTASGMSSNTQYSRIFASSSATATTTQIGTVNYIADTWAQTQFVFTATAPYVVANFGWLNAASSFDCFFLAEVSPSTEVSTAKLEKAIADAEDLLASTVEGTARGEYPAAAREALSKAIATAQDALQATTQDAVNEATTALLAAIDAYKAAVVKPFKVGVGYTFTNVASGSLSLSTGTGTVQIATANPADSTQVFYFEPAPEGAEKAGYNLRDANGTYIYRSGSWDTKSGSTDLTKANAIFNIVDYGTYIQIKNEGSGSVLGVDNTTSGSAVYSNKNGQAAKNNWTLMAHTPTAALEAKIAEAKQLLADTEVGTEYWQVAQTAADALSQAIAKAEAALPAITTFAEAEAAAKELEEAIAVFKTAFNPLPEFDGAQTYTVTHYGGNLLTATTSGNATITAKAESGATDAQLVTLEKVTYEGKENVYKVRSVSDGTYLTRDGSYNTLWQVKDTVAAYIQINRLDGKYLGLAFVSTDTYLGSDGVESGTALYSDKAGAGNTNAYWTIAANVSVQLDRAAFNAALEKANAAANAMVEGYKKGQYFAEDIAAFRAAIASARSKANKAMTQEELDAVTAQLLADIEVYVAKAHTEDILNKNPLTKAIATAEAALAKAEAGDFDGQYPQVAIDAYSAAVGQAKQALANEAATQDELDAATEALVAAGKTFDAARVVIDYTALAAQIAEAKKVLTDALPFKGEGAGKYPESAFTALQAAIDHAEALRKANRCNQATVGEETATLGKAVDDFKASYVSNDYTELQELVNIAEDLIRKAETGEIVCDPVYLQDLKDSYAKNAAALESTDQDVIDRAAKMLRRDIEIFRINVEETTGIITVGRSQVTFAVSQGMIQISNLPAGARVRVFNQSGQLVSTSAMSQLRRGVYVIRIEMNGQAVTKKVGVR